MKKYFILLLFIAVVCETQAVIRYVTPTGSGTGTTSWANASNDLQLMINQSAVGDTIWVAAGTYYPTKDASDDGIIYNNTGVYPIGSTDNRHKAFVLRANIHIYGGFPNTGSATWAQRDWNTYPTILSGDIGVPNDNIDNCYKVVVSAGNVGTACLDGFTITKGNSDDPYPFSEILVNGNMIHDMFYSHASGILIYSSSPILTNLTISKNYGYTAESASIFIKNSSSVLTNITVTENSNIGISVFFSPLTLTLTNVIITKNYSYGILSDNTTFALTNATISNNVGGIYTDIEDMDSPSIVDIRNSIIFGNEDTNKKGHFPAISNICIDTTLIYHYTSATVIYQNCLVGSEPLGNGIISNSDPLFVDTANGDYRLTMCSPAIDVGNNAFLAGITTDLDGNPRIHNGIVDLGAYEFQGTIYIADTTYYSASICPNATYNDNNFTNVTTAGHYYKTLKKINGCDSLVCLTLMIDSAYFTPITASICQGDAYNFFGKSLTTNGIYLDTLPTINGCDSIIELNLTVNLTYFTKQNDTICEGDSYNFFGKNLTTNGIYLDTLPTINGCDSIFELDLKVKPATKIDSITVNTDAKLLCDGDELKIEVTASGEDLMYQWFQDGNLLSNERNREFFVPSVTALQSGTYYVEVTGACGSETSQTVKIEAGGGNMLVEKWNDVIFVDNSSWQYVGYQWYRDGKILNAATEQFYQEIGGLNGCYSVELLLEAGGKMRSCEHCAYKTTKSFSIYPNPTSGMLKVGIAGQTRNDGADIEIYNVVGQVVFTSHVSELSPETTIDISHLSNGMYFLKIDNKMFKIIKN